MTIKQHAEAAVKDIARTYREIGHMEGIGHPAEWAQVTIAKHMQSAIVEATAKQMSWIAILNSEIARLEADVVRANTERVHTQKAYQETNREVVQTLGKALHYPWFKDDQKNFPGATEEDGVEVGDHVSESLAAEAAKRIAELEGLGPLIEEYVAETHRMFSIADHSDQMIELDEQINAILKGGAS